MAQPQPAMSQGMPVPQAPTMGAASWTQVRPQRQVWACQCGFRTNFTTRSTCYACGAPPATAGGTPLSQAQQQNLPPPAWFPPGGWNQGPAWPPAQQGPPAKRRRGGGRGPRSSQPQAGGPAGPHHTGAFWAQQGPAVGAGAGSPPDPAALPQTQQVVDLREQLRIARDKRQACITLGLAPCSPDVSSFDAEIASCEAQLESLRSPAAKLKSARKRLEAAKKQQKAVATDLLQQRDIVAKAADRVRQLEVTELRLAGELADAASHLQTCESAAAAGTAVIPIAGAGSAAAGPPDPSAVLRQVAASLAAGDEQAMRWFDKIVIAVRAASSSSALPVQPPGADASKKEENEFQARRAVYAAGVAAALPGLPGAGPAPKSPPTGAPASPGPKSPKKKVRPPAAGAGTTPAAKVQRRLLKRRSSAQPHGPDPAPQGEAAASDPVDQGMTPVEEGEGEGPVETL